MSPGPREYLGTRSLVLGASGFIGRWVARRLVEAGAEVVSTVRNPAAFDIIAKRWGIAGDVVALNAMDGAAIDHVIDQARPDIVFNLVGYGVDRTETNADAMHQINCELVRRLANVVAGTSSERWEGRRLVHVGSALEYGLVEGVVREETMPLPHTEYGRTKLAGTLALTEIATAANLDSVTARAFTVFGPGEHRGRLLPTIRDAAASGAKVKLSAGTQRRDFGYVEDVAEGLLRLGLSSGPPGEVVNLATGRLTSVREFAATAAVVMGLDADRLEFGTEPIRPDEMHISGVDVTRFMKRTDWSMPADLDDSLRRAAEFEAAMARNSL